MRDEKNISAVEDQAEENPRIPRSPVFPYRAGSLKETEAEGKEEIDPGVIRNVKSFSLPRRRVLKKADQFRRLIRNGRRVGGGRISVYYLPSEGKPGLVGFTTVRKLGGAVERNRARRLMREVYRLHQKEMKEANDYLFLWKGAVKDWKFQDTEREMVKLLVREGLVL